MKRTLATFMILAILAALMTIGCDREIESKDPVRSAPAEPPVPVNLTTQFNDRTITLSWSITTPSVVDRYRVYRANSVGGEFRLIDSTSADTIELAGLPFDRSVWLSVTAVTTDDIEGRYSVPVEVTAGLLSLTIDDGDDFTRDRQVRVGFIVPAPAAYVELSESPDLTGAPIRPFSPNMDFELSDGDGLKTVYGRVTFNDGSVSGETISDEITLDRSARIDSVYFSPPATPLSAGDTAEFFLTAEGEVGGEASVSFGSVSNLPLRDDGFAADVLADDGIYSARYVVPIGQVAVDESVTGSFIDAAGNRAPDVVSSNRLNILTGQPPEPVSLAISLTDAETAHLTWTRNEDSDFSSYRVYRSVSEGINVEDSILTIAIFTSSSVLSHDDFISSPGIYYYRVFTFNAQGLSAGSNEVAVVR